MSDGMGGCGNVERRGAPTAQGHDAIALGYAETWLLGLE
jgi:hypothetical protein